MVALPAALLPHLVVVEPYLGSDASGPLYGPPVGVDCLVEDRTSTKRGGEGRRVADGSVIRAQLDAPITTESRVTWRGRVVEVVSVTRYDGGGLRTPDHIEVMVQ